MTMSLSPSSRQQHHLVGRLFFVLVLVVVVQQQQQRQQILVAAAFQPPPPLLLPAKQPARNSYSFVSTRTTTTTQPTAAGAVLFNANRKRQQQQQQRPPRTFFFFLWSSSSSSSSSTKPSTVVTGTAEANSNNNNNNNNNNEMETSGASKEEGKDPENQEEEIVVEDPIAQLKAQAARVRLEAELLDMKLTLQKIATLETKVASKKWMDKHTEQDREAVVLQMEQLRQKLLVVVPSNGTTATTSAAKQSTSSTKDSKGGGGGSGGGAGSSGAGGATQFSSTTTRTTSTKTSITTSSTSTSSTRNKPMTWADRLRQNRLKDHPISGFFDSDLQVFLPVALEMQAQLANTSTTSSLEDQVAALQAAPELQAHFQSKIQNLLVQPMQDLQRLEEIKTQYLYSTSQVEKEQLKREMKRLEAALDEAEGGGGPVIYSDSLFLNIEPMTEEELQQRVAALQELPPVLQALYKIRAGANATTDTLEFAIALEHYETQLQLLEQAQLLQITPQVRQELYQSVESLPTPIRRHVARTLHLPDSVNVTNVETLVVALEAPPSSAKARALKALKGAVGGILLDQDDDEDEYMEEDLPEYDDIDFIDRSRYVEELFPAVARVEGQHPSAEHVDAFVTEVIDKKLFMVTSRPERVVGGYYVRGVNLMNNGDDNDNKDFGTPHEELVQRVQAKLENHPLLRDKLVFFYIEDPQPLMDELIDMGEEESPVFLVTSHKDTLLYPTASRIEKALVSGLGLVSVATFALSACAMQPTLQEQLHAVASTGDWTVATNVAAPIASSMLTIQLAHELAHGVVAIKDKFRIGLPNLIPSLQLGLQGAITSFQSPPPNLKSLFDFAIAGPLAGLLASIAFLVAGLGYTASMDMTQWTMLPVLPLYLIQASALGSGLVELYLGKGSLLPSTGTVENSVVALHPFAIAGFVGMLSNALALLPLGNTDGGRIALAMFGRRGCYIVSTFTLLLLCVAGIFGLDESRIFLTYVLFAMIWQRGCEAPTRNEVDELDFPRGAVGIGAALLVALALIPKL